MSPLRIKLKLVQKICALAGLTILVWASLFHPLFAQSVTQGYKSDVPVQRGMVVVIRSDDPTKIEPASADNIEKISGIVVNANDAPVTISSEDQKNFVATVGRYEVLVSNQNGDIALGDYLSISAIQGVAMKADNKQKIVIGKALAAFTPAEAFGQTTLKDSAGSAKEVKLGRIIVDISVTRNPLLRPEEANVPEFLRRISEGVAQKPVSPVRVYISLALLLIAGVITGSMLFSGIRSTLISIGRNPLGKKSIYKGLAQIVVASLIVFIASIFGVYLLLRL